jgi:DNA-binding IclR family transcriptional regulator
MASIPHDPRALFGSSARTKVLVVLNMIEDSHVRELQRLADIDFTTVRRVVGNLEREGVVAGRTIGTTRRISFDPRYYAVAELRALLGRLESVWPELAESVSALRKRPRRAGKSAPV